MATNQVYSNGHNGYSGKSVNELLALYNANKRPGRPNAEQRELKSIIEHLTVSKASEAVPMAAPKKSRKAMMAAAPLEVAMDADVEAPKKGRAAKAPKAPKAPIAEIINVPDIAVGCVPITIEGTEMLIVHAWDVKSKRQIEEKQQKKARGQREARDPDAEFHAARYLDHKNQDCLPARCIKNAIVQAATFLPDVTKRQINGALYVKGDLLPILDSRTGKPLKGVRRDDMVRIGGMSKVADIRYRPMYENWKVNFEVEFDTSVFSVEQVVNLVNRAGFNVGVCEWRPTYGRFKVISTSSKRK